MLDKIFKHFLVVGFGTIVSMFLGLLTTPLITRIVSPYEYGQFSIFLMYGQIGILVLILGLDQSIVRFFYESENLEYKKWLLKSCLKWPVIIGLITSVIFISLLLSDVLTFEFSFKFAVLLCLYIFLLIISRFVQLIVRLEYNSKLYSSLNIIQKLIYIIITVPFIYFYSQDYLLILVLATIAALGVCIIIGIYKYKNIWNFVNLSVKNFNVTEKQLIIYAYPYIIAFAVIAVFNSSDKLVLNYYCSYEDIGIYASALSLISILNLIQSTFNTLWAPLAVKHFTDFPDDKELYIKANKIITVVMFCIGIVLILSKDLFVLLLGDKYREASYLLPCLIFNPIMYTISETTVLGLVFMQKSKAHTLVALGSAITNVVLCFALIPFFGIKGAAIANALAYIVFFSIRTYLSNKYFKVEYDLKKFYILTFSCLFFALYNTFMLINVLSYIFCIFILLLIWYLYKDTVVFIIEYARKLLPFDV